MMLYIVCDSNMIHKNLIFGIISLLCFTGLHAQKDFCKQNSSKFNTLSCDSLQLNSFVQSYKLKQSNFLLANSELPFFCRLEQELWKNKGLKTSFRLGSLNYSNSLEYGNQRRRK